MKRIAAAALLSLTLPAAAQDSAPAPAAPEAPAASAPVPATTPDAPVPSATAAPPVIRAIVFEGNEKTRPEVMLREMVVKVGEPADPARIERSRQGVQDLGLFKSVEARTTPQDDGVRLTFVVRERWYFLPVPRVDANSEGENAYGASLRWYNVTGRNDTVRANWTRRDEQKENKGESTSYSGGYAIPFVYDSPYSVGFSTGHSSTPITDFGGYVETGDHAAVSVSRAIGNGPASQGWTAGTTLTYTRQATDGPSAPAPYGHATALGLSLDYRDVRNNIYSDEGVAFGAAATGATEDIASEYSFASGSAYYSRYRRVGRAPHQNWNLYSRVGSYHGGPTEYKTYRGVYALGGASVLRAYPSDFLMGDFYYYVGTEYLRPVGVDWARVALIAEAGNVFTDASEMHDRVHGSLGIALRVRFTFLVNVEVEAGLAWPLDGGDQRFFASKV